MRQIVVSLVLASGAFAFAQAPPMPPGVTDVRLDSTPVTQAICLAGAGDATAYAQATTQLFSYLVSHKIAATSIFFGTWDPGTEPLKGADAKWEICSEVAAKPADVAHPYAFRDIAAQPAVRAKCVMSTDKLGACFEALIAYAKQQNRVPATPPRFKSVGAEGNPTYDVWLPLRAQEPAAPAANPGNQEEGR